MNKAVAHNTAFRPMQYLLLALMLFVQGQAAVKATEHAASGGYGIYCGDGTIPAEAAANLKYLLALQGESADGTAIDCELCFNFTATENRGLDLTCAELISIAATGMVPNAAALALADQVNVPVGLRAPPVS